MNTPGLRSCVYRPSEGQTPSETAVVIVTWMQVACGSVSSFACMVGGQLCAWGKLKAAGDTTMYPKPYMDLGGWQVRHMACGSQTFVCAAFSGEDQSVVTW